MVGKKRISARNNAGRITVRHRGGGHKRLYRAIDFKRDKDGVPAKVKRIEYDPNRTAFIALVSYSDGSWRYIVAPKGLKVGDTVLSGDKIEAKLGYCLQLKHIPAGTVMHNVELKPGAGGQIARSAGTSVVLLSHEERYALIKMKSGEVRRIQNTGRATIGQVSNGEHGLRQYGKAGVKRWLGWRPTVRGVAMNPVDHPHGGGEGRTSGGRHPVTPWGVGTKGKKTRAKKKRSNNMIVASRSRKRR